MIRPVALTLAVAVALGGPASAGRTRTAGVRVPPGFSVGIFASGLDHPTALAWGPDRRLYVTEDVGNLVATTRGSRSPAVVARSLRTPLGLAWSGHKLFVSEQGRMERMQLRGRRLLGRRTLVSGLPYGRHQQDNVVVGPNGRLFFGSGSTCNACAERDRRSAAILSMRQDGRGLSVVARGLRNPYGLAFQPRTHRLFASVNGRDDVDSPGDPEPAESVVAVARGARYGWPACWPSARLLRMVGACRGVTSATAYLEPHSSADGIAFYTGRSFPAEYRGDLFVAEWGQYNERTFGRRVVRVQLNRTATSARVSTFASGIDHPLALAVDRGGALLVADWGRGVIYRIQARGRP
jgi:glucose/arabinose dehydrogenase